MAYLVGLTATDGCLITGRKAINFKSADRELVELYLLLLGRANKVGIERTRAGGLAYKTQFSDARWYEWLQAIGLSPRKSLTLGRIDVPQENLLPLVRGLLDGDGSVINKVFRADTGRRADYFWEHLITRFHSASESHLMWIRERLASRLGLMGSLQPQPIREGRQPFFHLVYGKKSSQVLLPLLYPPGAPCLDRKRNTWVDYASRHQLVVG